MDVVTVAWERTEALGRAEDPDRIPVIAREAVAPAVPGTWIWDPWPVREADGSITPVAGGELWMALSAPAEAHPGGRHDVARILLLHRVDGAWRSLGPVFPDSASAGSREWAGSAWHSDGQVAVDYTAAGVRGEDPSTFRQRIFTTTATLSVEDGTPALTGWAPHRELVVADGTRYRRADEVEGEAGFIKAFRDPFRFRDDEGTTHVLFTASVPGSETAHDGAVGIATLDPDSGTARLHPPLVTADGVNNELERPHVVEHDGRLLLFISTQARTFHADVPNGLSGLYGWTAEQLGGPWRPLNGSGLVAATPPAEPFQSYSWLVLPDLAVVSFVDSHSLGGRHPAEIDEEGEAAARNHFGGTFAPEFRLWVDGDRAGIA